jgi:hypothetical protein
MSGSHRAPLTRGLAVPPCTGVVSVDGASSMFDSWLETGLLSGSIFKLCLRSDLRRIARRRDGDSSDAVASLVRVLTAYEGWVSAHGTTAVYSCALRAVAAVLLFVYGDEEQVCVWGGADCCGGTAYYWDALTHVGVLLAHVHVRAAHDGVPHAAASGFGGA